MIGVPQPSEQSPSAAQKWLILTVICASGALLGLRTTGLMNLGILAAAVGIALNLSLMLRVVVSTGHWDMLPRAVLGGVIAGLYDGTKIFGFALVVRFVAGAVPRRHVAVIVTLALVAAAWAWQVDMWRKRMRARMASRTPSSPTGSTYQALPRTPKFEPLSDEAFQRITSAVRDRLADGSLVFEWPEGADRRSLHPSRVWAIAHNAAPAGFKVRTTERFEEIGPDRRPPMAYGVDFAGCWIAYLEPKNQPLRIGSSTIVAIRDSDAKVVYVGSANDEG